jgi:hypothetical protein
MSRNDESCSDYNVSDNNNVDNSIVRCVNDQTHLVNSSQSNSGTSQDITSSIKVILHIIIDPF